VIATRGCGKPGSGRLTRSRAGRGDVGASRRPLSRATGPRHWFTASGPYYDMANVMCQYADPMRGVLAVRAALPAPGNPLRGARSLSTATPTAFLRGERRTDFTRRRSTSGTSSERWPTTSNRCGDSPTVRRGTTPCWPIPPTARWPDSGRWDSGRAGTALRLDRERTALREAVPAPVSGGSLRHAGDARPAELTAPAVREGRRPGQARAPAQACFRSSSRPIWRRWTSSGPSAKRSVREWAHQ
jgi:hypothetical protein